jgi:DNA polymerase III delta prime subunit
MDPLVVPSLQEKMSECQLPETLRSQADSELGDHTDTKSGSESELSAEFKPPSNGDPNSELGDDADAKSSSESELPVKSKPPSNGDPLVVPYLKLISRAAAEKLPKSQLPDSKLVDHTVDAKSDCESELPAESKQPSSDGDWEPPKYFEWRSQKTGRLERELISANEDEKKVENPFEVSYERKTDWPEEMSVTLFSSHLVEVITRCFPDNKWLCDTATPKISGNDLFLRMDKIHEISGNDLFLRMDKTARLHIGYLLRFLKKEFKGIQTKYNRMMQESRTSWPLLWAFLPPGEKVYYNCEMSGELVYGIVHGRSYDKSARILNVELKVMDYNGDSYRECTRDRKIKEFEYERSFHSLPVCPMRFAKERCKQMEATFLANGKRFYELSVKAQNSFMLFEGALLRWERIPGTWCQSLAKHKADGRVMIDHWSFFRMNPSYDMGKASPGTADYHRRRALGLQEHEDSAGSSGNDEVPNEESLQLAPAIVYGFSFRIKKWGCFPVTGFRQISFDDHAFDRHLVMGNEVQKEMLLGLVSQHLQEQEPIEGLTNKGMLAVDHITSKGEGCIFLCYGPPGTGKTLTAEAIAEKLHRPLWTISASELRFEVDEMEVNLVQILDIAYSWRAVLLLDEADIYLEKRTSAADATRNAMTGIFLRVLEYYKGILFLTTNRVTAFDDAFCSRISMLIRYHPLTHSSRAKVWETLLCRAELRNVDLDMFAALELNGREIRNCIRIAHTWATSCKEPLTTERVLEVVKMFQKSRNDLKDAVCIESQGQFSAAPKAVTTAPDKLQHIET